MESNNINQVNYTQIYSELSRSDISTLELIERCELLTQILLDCNNSYEGRAVSRCLGAYIDVLETSLKITDADLSSIVVSESDILILNESVFSDEKLLCDYCMALNISLGFFEGSNEIRVLLTGLLHDLVYQLSELVTESKFKN